MLEGLTPLQKFIAKKGQFTRKTGEQNNTETGNKHQATKKETKKRKENAGIK
jgi:hypothetical protein